MNLAAAMLSLAAFTAAAGGPPPTLEGAIQAQAISADGRWRLVAHGPPHRLSLFDGAGHQQRQWRTTTLDGRRDSAVTSLQAHRERRSFVLALPAIAELWEISLDPEAEPIADGLVHDWRLREGHFTPGFLGVRRTRLDQPVARFVLGPGKAAVTDEATGIVVNLDIRRAIGRVPAAAAGPASGAGRTAAPDSGRP